MPNQITGQRIAVRPDNRVEIEPFTPRLPEHGEVLVETLYTLISAGTELGVMEQARTQDFYPGYSNVGRIIALGKGDLSDFRLSIASAHGATHTLNPQTDDLPTAIHDITNGRGLDCIIEASGYPQLLPLLFDLARIGGRVLLLGSIWHRKVEVDFMPFHLKELTLIGVHQPKCPTTETPYFPWTQQYNRRQVLKGKGRSF